MTKDYQFITQRDSKTNQTTSSHMKSEVNKDYDVFKKNREEKRTSFRKVKYVRK
jgi:hypothetical protein